MQEEKKEAIKKNIRDLWERSTDLPGSDPVSEYLRSQGLNLTTQNLRYCSDCFEQESGVRLPAMIAKVQSSETAWGLHITYLSPNGKIADVTYPRRILGEKFGASVQLFPRDSKLFPCKGHGILGVAEGIENSLAAAALYLMPVWAVPAGAYLESFISPTWAREIIIFSDNDANFSGQVSSYTLAKRLFDEGKIVSVEMPELSDMTFFDCFQERQPAT